MKPGQLRRFSNDMMWTPRAKAVAGRTFVILEVIAGAFGLGTSNSHERVSLIVDGRIEEDWNYDWVYHNSEAISESR